MWSTQTFMVVRSKRELFLRWCGLAAGPGGPMLPTRRHWQALASETLREPHIYFGAMVVNVAKSFFGSRDLARWSSNPPLATAQRLHTMASRSTLCEEEVLSPLQNRVRVAIAGAPRRDVHFRAQAQGEGLRRRSDRVQRRSPARVAVRQFTARSASDRHTSLAKPLVLLGRRQRGFAVPSRRATSPS